MTIPRPVRIAIIILGIAVLALAAVGWVLKDQIIASLFKPTASSVQQGTSQPSDQLVSVAASKLETPWSITFTPNGDMLVTERSGQLHRIGDDGKVYTIDGVQETGEGGLLGVALHPDFETNNLLYIYKTTSTNSGLRNQVERYALQNDQLSARQVILADIPAASNHNGGGIAFGPDDKLYITTGDAATANLAQDTTSLAGKILRLNDDGSSPGDNPFGNAVWSYGHRNPQGIAWDSQDRLWSVEHGPSGELKGRGKDELNLIEKGANYGWPVIAGDEKRDNMRTPVAQSGDSDTWAPVAIAYYDGSLYFAGLRGESLYEAKIGSDTDVSLVRHFTSEYGRLRAVTAHDGKLYVSTSNRDGRGSPKTDDDKILKVDLKKLSL